MAEANTRGIQNRLEGFRSKVNPAFQTAVSTTTQGVTDVAGRIKNSDAANQTIEALNKSRVETTRAIGNSSAALGVGLVRRVTDKINGLLGLPPTVSSGGYYTYGGSEYSLSGLLFLAIVIVLVLMIVYLMYKAAPTIVKHVKSLV